ncbi:MAG: hypothetical protein ACOVLK_05950, partial [Terrimicrobiaceae bacterium]
MRYEKPQCEGRRNAAKSQFAQSKSPPPRRAPRSPAQARPKKQSPAAPPAESSQKLRAGILRLIGQRPLDAAALASALDLPPAWRAKLPQLLKEMETAGDIARIRKDR